MLDKSWLSLSRLSLDIIDPFDVGHHTFVLDRIGWVFKLTMLIFLIIRYCLIAGVNFTVSTAAPGAAMRPGSLQYLLIQSPTAKLSGSPTVSIPTPQTTFQ